MLVRIDMPKPGDEYQEIVGLVRRALDPEATVKTGQWIKGPDGDRDLDVEVRGTLQGKDHFALVECKDWKRRVGIEVVDALESKRHDLGADSAAIYSNSGFADPALRKAKRVGIRMFSALRAGDDRIRYIVYKEVIAVVYSVDKYSIRFSCEEGQGAVFPDGWTPHDIKHAGLPLVNFLRDESMEILKQRKRAGGFTATYAFAAPIHIQVRGQDIGIKVLQLRAQCRQKYVSQVIEEDVTLGQYDFLNDAVSIPNKQTLILGTFDNSKWKEIDTTKFKIESQELQPKGIQLGLTLFNPIGGIDGIGTPPISTLVKERTVDTNEKSR